jgi:hypothetical protein
VEPSRPTVDLGRPIAEPLPPESVRPPIDPVRPESGRALRMPPPAKAPRSPVDSSAVATGQMSAVPVGPGEMGMVTTGMQRAVGAGKWARVHMQRQLQQVYRLRAATVIAIVLAVVGAPAAFFVIREFTRDPVFVELDGLDVPKWAAGKHTDGAYGSRWCIRECRFRERTWESERGPQETNDAYVTALHRNGWTTWDVPDCQPQGVDGLEACWQRDEYVLDLWVRAAVCEVKPVRPTVDPSAVVPGASGKPPSGAPKASAAPLPAGPSAPPSASADPSCPGAVTTVKVFNRIMYQAPQSSTG